MSKKNIDLNEYDVTVVKQIALGNQIIGVGIYPAPVQKILLDFAVTQVEEIKPLAYLSKDGDRVNPFVVLDDTDGYIPPEDDDVDDIDIESMFKSADEFGSLSDKKQTDYIKSVKETPTDLSEDEAVLYDEVLYQNLVEYKKVAKAKTTVLVDDVLASYDDTEEE